MSTMQDDLIEAIQAAVVTTINTLGVTLLGPKFTPITSSPIPDDEVARIAGVDFTVHRDPPFYDIETCLRCSHSSHVDDCACGCERP